MLVLILVGCTGSGYNSSNYGRSISAGYKALEVPNGSYSGNTELIEIPYGAPPPERLRSQYQMFGQSIFTVRGNYNEASLIEAGRSVGADLVICYKQVNSPLAAAMFLRRK